MTTGLIGRKLGMTRIFSDDGTVSWFLYEQSENLLEVPTFTPPIKPAGAPSLPIVDVGRRPMGLALSPVSDLAFVLNVVDRTVSVVDLPVMTKLADVPDQGRSE